MQYRKDIDGLRAIAVLPVILFHAGFSYFQGGFLGVDIFFVISGDLITGLIIRELEKETFQISSFYLRRAKRLLPALFFVSITSFVVGYFLLLPIDLKNLSQSLTALSIFSTNIFFWLTTDYFSSAAELKPLLHTWSLAVEEQFYIFFPIFLLTIASLGRTRIFLIILTLASISLLYFFWVTNIDYHASFFLLPSRAWELLVGALLALYLANNHVEYFTRKTNNLMSSIGLLLIVFSILTFDSFSNFSNFYILFSVIGTLLVICFSEQTTITYKLLSSPVLVGLGLISYSMYLWHQPILAFSKYVYVESLPQSFLLLLCSSIIPIGYLSWRYIEQPARDNKNISLSKYFVSLSIVAFSLIFLIGILGHFSDGFQKRKFLSEPHKYFSYELFNNVTPANQQSIKCIKEDFSPCMLNQGKAGSVILVGDSHADDLVGEFYKFAKNNDIAASHLIEAGCSFTSYALITNQCLTAKAKLIEISQTNTFDTIVVVISIYEVLDDLHVNEVEPLLNDLFGTMKLALSNNKKVLFIIPRPTLSLHPIRATVFRKDHKIALVSLKHQSRAEHFLDQYKHTNNLTFASEEEILINGFCKNKNNCTYGIIDDHIAYRDSNHLTGFGSQYVFDRLSKKIELK